MDVRKDECWFMSKTEKYQNDKSVGITRTEMSSRECSEDTGTCSEVASKNSEDFRKS